MPRRIADDQPEYVVRYAPPDYAKKPSGRIQVSMVYAGETLMGALYHDGEGVLGFLRNLGVDADGMTAWWRDTLRGAYVQRTPAQEVWAYWTTQEGNQAMDLAEPVTYDTLDALLEVLTGRA